MFMDLEALKKLNIPSRPGVYRYLDGQRKTIYIGKAVNLRSRVFSYWRDSANLSLAKKEMLKKTNKVEWEETETEVEALLLEANLVKKFQPYYNVMLRDDKRFSYIKISTEEEVPRIFLTRQVDKAGRYFGPFVSALAVKETLKLIRKIWPYRSCRHLPPKTCLYYRINKCLGMCEHPETRKENLKNIRQIIKLLEGGKKAVILEIKKEIKSLEAQENKTEEMAGRLEVIKFRLLNLERVLSESRLISVAEKYASDVVELAKVLGLPRVPVRIEGYDISNIFGQSAVGSMVVFANGEPDKNEYRKFKIKLSAGKTNDTLMLKEVLERRFKHSVAPSTDRLDQKWPVPDLLIVDGGKGQLNAAVSILKKYKLDIPILSISKGQGLRSAQAPDKIFFPGEKQALELSLASPALHIIKRVRDEAHRFAISYYRELKRKKFWV